jgi:hypothetical protein
MATSIIPKGVTNVSERVQLALTPVWWRDIVLVGSEEMIINPNKKISFCTKEEKSYQYEDITVAFHIACKEEKSWRNSVGPIQKKTWPAPGVKRVLSSLICREGRLHSDPHCPSSTPAWSAVNAASLNACTAKAVQ